MLGINFNGKHSYRDLGLTLADHKIGNPSKIKRKIRVPYSNKYYDFSTLYKGQEYTERELTFVFNLLDSHERNFYTFETQIDNWLMQSSELSKLTFDLVKGYYFMAEVDQSIDAGYQIDFNWGTLTVTFTAYSFKIAELREGNDIWDTFNFILDYAQLTKFEINGTKEISLYNPSATIISPTIVASNQMEIVKGHMTYTLPAGTTESDDFTLDQDENKLIIKGNGTIEFVFHKELI